MRGERPHIQKIIWDPKGAALSLGSGDRRSPDQHFLGGSYEGGTPSYSKNHLGVQGQSPWSGILRAQPLVWGLGTAVPANKFILGGWGCPPTFVAPDINWTKIL